MARSHQTHTPCTHSGKLINFETYSIFLGLLETCVAGVTVTDVTVCPVTKTTQKCKNAKTVLMR